MNKILFLFDVDGTLTESSAIICDSMKNKLKDLIKNNIDIGIVGGGKLDKILLQMGDDLYFKHYFTECGCIYNKNELYPYNIKLKEIYCKNIREHKLYPQINILIKESLKYLSNVDYTLTGNFIDLRSGIIYISPIGMSANNDERKYFIELNNKYKYKEKLLELLLNKAEELKIIQEIDIVEGGSVGIAIYPKEYDKVQVVDSLINNYDTIHYFGDKYLKNGNDYNLLHHRNIRGHRVDNYNDTIDIINIVKKFLSDSKP